MEAAAVCFREEPFDSLHRISRSDDANSGEAPETPWQHHPWDPSAAGKSATGAGVHTYVFKRGVIYRGRLVVKDAGQDGQPIRLTSDPAWGA